MIRRFPALVATLLMIGPLAPAPHADTQPWVSKLGPVRQQRLTHLTGQSRIVVRATSAATGAPLTMLVRLVGGHVLRPLPIIDGLEIDLPNAAIGTLASSSLVAHMSIDRPV